VERHRVSALRDAAEVVVLVGLDGVVERIDHARKVAPCVVVELRDAQARIGDGRGAVGTTFSYLPDGEAAGPNGI